MSSQIQAQYQLLGVTEDTPISQIRLARKRRLAEVHPDRFEAGDSRRESAEEAAKQINQAFEAIRQSRLRPTKMFQAAAASQPAVERASASSNPIAEEVRMKPSRKRLETVESRVVVRNGKVVMIKRKRAVKYGLLKDLRDSARNAVLGAIDSVERRVLEIRQEREQRLLERSLLAEEQKSRAHSTKVVHIVEGTVTVSSM